MPQPTKKQSPKKRTSKKKPTSASEERCLYCSGKRITKKGWRRKKFETVQLWHCKDCDQVFTPRALKGKTYPTPVTLEGLNYYNTGYSLEASTKRLKERYGISVTPTTLSRWLDEHKELLTYARLREPASALFPPQRIIQSTRLHHQQVYHYRFGNLEGSDQAITLIAKKIEHAIELKICLSSVGNSDPGRSSSHQSPLGINQPSLLYFQRRVRPDTEIV